MWKKDNIQAELQEIAPVLAAIPNINVYRVNAGYFNDLPAKILQQLPEEKEELFAFSSSNKKQPYATPAGYFDTLTQNIMASVRAAENAPNEVQLELLEVAPLLAQLSKEQVFTVPAGYFESLKANISQDPLPELFR